MAVGVKVQRARTGAGFGAIDSGWRKHGSGRVQAVDVDAVAAQVVNVGKAVVRREGGKVGMGALLAIGVGAVSWCSARSTRHGAQLGPH